MKRLLTLTDEQRAEITRRYKDVEAQLESD